jgi:multiple antibiotic resistance protein
MELAYVFTIFMLTLGPIKVIPAFAALVGDATTAQVRAVALRGIAWSTGISLFIAFGVTRVQESWQVSLEAIRIAGGILLFMSAAATIGQVTRPQAPGGTPAPSTLDAAALRRAAFMPVAIPIIITPWGVVAILLFMRMAEREPAGVAGVIGILLLVMALNFLGMVFARWIMKTVGFATFQLLGWIFGIMQCGLAVQVILLALRNLGLIPP